MSKTFTNIHHRVLMDIAYYFVRRYRNAAPGSAEQKQFSTYILAITNADRMLKGQEPRVLTFEEIKENEMYWMEGTYCNGIRFKPIIVTNVGDFDHWVNYYTTDGYEGMTKSEYGKTWRCWSEKPTKEQREVIPWDI